MSAALQPIPVPGVDTPILAAQHQGRPFVPLRPICDALGIDVDSQRRKLDQAEWAVTVLITATGSDGKSYRMVAIDADHLPMWLATIQTRRVAESARPILAAFQREAAGALRDYFYRGVAVQAAPASQLDILRAAIDQIEAAQNTAAEAKQIAATTAARLDAIEGRHDWYAALGWARLNGVTDTSQAALAKLGRIAGGIARRNHIEPVKVRHQIFGLVNSLPAWVWEEAAAELGWAPADEFSPAIGGQR